MAYEFKLPDIGEGVVEGEIVKWLVKEGDQLHLDQPMVEIMTDKATVEIPAPRAGKVLKRMYAEGQTCPVGKVLIAIEEAGGSVVQEPAAAPQPAAPPLQSVERAGERPPAALQSPAAPAAASTGQIPLATPATRKLARDLGVDLTSINGSGPAGRITSDDVRAAKEAPTNGRRAADVVARAPRSVPAGPDVRVPFRGLRKKIAENMVRSKREAAHFTYVEEVDCTQLVDLRSKANARLAGIKLSYLPFIVKATVDALKKFPQLNAILDEQAGEIVQRREYHVGVAAQTEDGLIVPVLRHADRKSIVELAREIDRLAAATKAGKATREELTGSTFTITSLGTLGGVLATPIINYPEVAILGVHKIAKRPAVFEDKIVIRDMMNLSISVDHRLVDGYDAARFVAEVKDSLESPGLLFLESV
ncbi:MAG TPA: dihydrolipoamide acetyltransferase family protein [Polyangia bacterium]|nr:dihydrolipoamide acetyltransferase family protein [Polyangia bacterium]